MTPIARRLLGIGVAIAVPLMGCMSTTATPAEVTARPTPAATAPAPEPSPTARDETPSPTPEPEPVRWQRVDATGPSAREDHTWTVTGDGRTALLFGGRDGAAVFGDLWSFDFGTNAWTQLETDGGPAARFGHDAAWVDGVGLVVFAGQAGTAFFGDLWAYDPVAARWTELPAAGDAPVPRYGTCAAVGPDGRLWISHGFTSDGVRFSDTRAYDFDAGTWSDETPGAGARPVERCLHGCWWTDAGQLALYAGQTTGTTALADRWLLDDGVWAEVDGTLPPERNLYARARLDGAELVFGGQALDGSYRADLWVLADESDDAIEVAVEGDLPPARAGAELVHDAERGRVLLFGGRSADGALDDLWSLTGTIPLP